MVSLLGFILDENLHRDGPGRNRPLPIGHLSQSDIHSFGCGLSPSFVRSPVASRSICANTKRIPTRARPSDESSRIDSRIATSSFVPSLKYVSYSSQKCLIERDNLSNFSTIRTSAEPCRVRSASASPGRTSFPSRHHVLTQLHQLDSHHRAVALNGTPLRIQRHSFRRLHVRGNPHVSYRFCADSADSLRNVPGSLCFRFLRGPFRTPHDHSFRPTCGRLGVKT